MGINVGMPMLKLKRYGRSGKHAGNLKAIVMEAGEERASKTKNLDPTRSDLNLHLGPYSKGWDAVQAIEEEVADYETEYVKTSYLHRRMRSDAAVAVAFIVKPDGEWINSQTPEDQERFFSDSYDVLCELGIVKEKDVRMRERHLDEAAPHEHIISMAYDKNGKLAGSRIVNLKTFAKLNRDYPKKMQEKGWPVDELKAYDPEAVKDMTDEEKKAYKEELIKKKQAKKHGLSANAYAAMKDAEKANELRHALEDENQRLNDEVNEKLGDLEDVQELVADAKEELAELEPKRTQAKKDIEDAKEKKQEVFDAVYSLKNAMGMTSVYDNTLIIEKAKKWADELKEREAEVKRKESLIATWNAKAKEDASQAAEKLSDAKSERDEAHDMLTEAQGILDDAKAVESDSDSATLQKALKYMSKIRFPDGTTAKARFEAKYGTKLKVTRAYIQSSIDDLCDRIGQKQSDDDEYGYY